MWEPTDLFVSGTGGCHTYRIPALLATRAGTLLAFCEGRVNDAGDHGAIRLLLKRSGDGGRTWSAPGVVWDTRDGAEGVCMIERGSQWIPVEIKWTDPPSAKAARHLRVFMQENPKTVDRGYIICRCPTPQMIAMGY